MKHISFFSGLKVAIKAAGIVIVGGAAPAMAADPPPPPLTAPRLSW